MLKQVNFVFQNGRHMPGKDSKSIGVEFQLHVRPAQNLGRIRIKPWSVTRTQQISTDAADGGRTNDR